MTGRRQQMMTKMGRVEGMTNDNAGTMTNDNTGTMWTGDTMNDEADSNEDWGMTYDTPLSLQMWDREAFLSFFVIWSFFSLFLSISNIPPLWAPAHRVM
jgi:hypothetical protein